MVYGNPVAQTERFNQKGSHISIFFYFFNRKHPTGDRRQSQGGAPSLATDIEDFFILKVIKGNRKKSYKSGQ